LDSFKDPIEPELTMADFKDLALVRHKSGGPLYLVVANYGKRATAIRHVDITNPSEWQIVKTSKEHLLDLQ